MSSKLNGVLPHNITAFEELEQLPARLEQFTKSARRIGEEYWQTPVNSEDTPWHIDVWGPPRQATPRAQWEVRRGPSVVGPSDLWLVFGRQCLFVTTPAKWLVAIQRPTLLHAVSDFLRALATLFGSPDTMLYREDGCRTWDWVLDGLNLNEIEQNMRSAQMRPAPHLQSLLSLAQDDPASWLYCRQSAVPDKRCP
jgi:hypothetical protein